MVHPARYKTLYGKAPTSSAKMPRGRPRAATKVDEAVVYEDLPAVQPTINMPLRADISPSLSDLFTLVVSSVLFGYTTLSLVALFRRIWALIHGQPLEDWELSVVDAWITLLAEHQSTATKIVFGAAAFYLVPVVFSFGTNEPFKPRYVKAIQFFIVLQSLLVLTLSIWAGIVARPEEARTTIQEHFAQAMLAE